jgi:DnaJ-class molecular chaperone
MQTQLINCPFCHGSGRGPLGGPCSQCKGAGQVAVDATHECFAEPGGYPGSVLARAFKRRYNERLNVLASLN